VPSRVASVLLALFIALPLAAQDRRRPAQKNVWRTPHCAAVTGTPAVTFTMNEGETLTPIVEQISGVTYTYGLVATDLPNTLYAINGASLLKSTNAGCHWTTVAALEGWDFPPSLLAATGGRIYGWSDNRDYFFRLDDRGVTKERVPVPNILGIAVDRANPDRLRIGGGDNTIWETIDGGRTWTFLSSIRTDAPSLYRIAFDPADLDHIVVGTLANGAFVSFNGGQTWTQSTGIPGQSTNVFQLVVSPVDGNVVWAMALNMSETEGDWPKGRRIYRSIDGGRTFTAVVDAGPEVTIINQPVMAAHPTDPDVLYFIFGSFFQGYGTDLFRYDAGTRQLTKTHNNYHGIDSIAFSPADPAVMYIGLENEQLGF
jgi:hypothetical protein